MDMRVNMLIVITHAGDSDLYDDLNVFKSCSRLFNLEIRRFLTGKEEEEDG